jgi:hypothetical protein
MSFYEEITINKLRCAVCNKQYTRKSSLDKHKILCDFKMKTKRERQIEEDELGDIPSHFQLVKIVQELTLKMIIMEEKMEQMQKYIDKKKHKLNIMIWLNTNVTPTIGFLEWVHTSLILKSEHFENLMDNTIFHTIQKIFEDNLYEKSGFIYPIRCFSQKADVFYICDKKEDGSSEWRKLVLTDMILILKIIQNGMIKTVSKWKVDNQNKFDDNDKISILFNKAVIKLMNISFRQDSNLSRIKNSLYNYLKTDLTSVVGVEFEF